MNPLARPHRAAPGFTLVELLVVISVMAVLAGILLPVISVVKNAASNANTESFIERIGMALTTYRQQYQVYPPDYIPASQKYYYSYPKPNTDGFQERFTVATDALPPETLHYYLTNPFVATESAFLQIRGGAESSDYNNNGLPEIVDSWGRPILYNRAKFPGAAASYYNYSAASPSEDSDNKPWHNKDSFDLFSIGEDSKTRKKGTTSDEQITIPDPGGATTALAAYVQQAIGQGWDGGGGTDDLKNW